MKQKTFKFSQEGMQEAIAYSPKLKTSTLIMLSTTIALNLLILAVESSNPAGYAFIPSEMDTLIKSFSVIKSAAGGI